MMHIEMVKMEIIKNNDKINNELLLIFNLFLNSSKLNLNSDISFFYECKNNILLCKTHINKKLYKKSFNLTDNSDAFVKRCLKIAFYIALSKYTGEKMPWGSLTGIRPTKLYYEIFNSNHSHNKTYKILKSFYLVDKTKIKLLQQIIKVQQTVFKKNSHQNKYDLYINIPFCSSRCYYCSFVSTIISEKNINVLDDYLDALFYELKETVNFLKLKNIKLNTVYIGGGTPTILNEENLEKLLKIIPSDIAEFTVEAGRPDSITKSKLDILQKYNVNRISINPQTFSDKTLKFIGRNHKSNDIVKTFKLARKYNFKINMDLIAGLYNEKFCDFKNSLKKTINLNPDNITVHTLCVKNSSDLKLNKAITSHSKDVVKMIKYSLNLLTKKKYLPYYVYRQKYMLGNLENIGYSKINSICENNINSMEEISSIIGVGANAISKRLFDNSRIERFANTKDISLYINNIFNITAQKIDFFK